MVCQSFLLLVKEFLNSSKEASPLAALGACILETVGSIQSAPELVLQTTAIFLLGECVSIAFASKAAT